MKVSKLSGAELDYWIAKAEGLKPYLLNGPEECCRVLLPSQEDGCTYAPYSPHSDWSIAGPIIERKRIGFFPNPYDWRAYAENDFMSGHGPSPLIAAMRAYVASHFGAEVSDETQTTPTPA